MPVRRAKAEHPGLAAARLASRVHSELTAHEVPPDERREEQEFGVILAVPEPFQSRSPLAHR